MIFYYVTVSNLVWHYSWLIIALVIPMFLYLATLAAKQLARETVIDAIEVYARWQTARFDEQTRQAKLTMWKRQARAQLAQQKKALQLGSAAMWKMGVFDVEIDEAIK